MSQLERLSFIDLRIKERGGLRLREIAERFLGASCGVFNGRGDMRAVCASTAGR